MRQAVVEAMRHKTGGPGFGVRWGPWKFSNDIILLTLSVALGFNQPLTEMSTN